MTGCGNISNFWRRAVVIGLLGCLMLAACAPFPAEEGKRRGGKRSSRSDPLAFPGDDVIVTETDVGLPDYSATRSDTTVTRQRARSTTPKEGGPGFDVHVFASLNIQEAKQVQRQTDTLSSMPIRVVFEEPYYKVMAGPFGSFEEAQQFLQLVSRLGYSTAWIVARKGKARE